MMELMNTWAAPHTQRPDDQARDETEKFIARYTRNTLFDEKIGGTTHFALGAGYPESGNSNQSGLHWDMVVDLRDGGYVEIDGVKINVDGKFTKDGFSLGMKPTD